MLEDNKNYLKRIIEEMDFAIRTTATTSKEQFITHPTLTRATSTSLRLIGEAAKGLDEKFISAYPEVSWSEMVVTSDKLLSDYRNTDYNIMWHTITKELPITRLQIEKIINSL